MFQVLANSFMNATRTQPGSHWGEHERFDDRRRAELIAHTEGRRRD